MNQLSAFDGSVMVVSLLLVLITLLLFTVPTLIILWKLFSKAGQPGWAAIVPYYNSYIMGVIAKNPTMAIVVIIISFASYLSYVTDAPAVRAILGLGFIVSLVLSIIIFIKFIMQYDAGIGKWILFLFFPIIGVFFVGKTNYKGGNPVVTSDQSATQPIDHTAPLPSAYGASRYSSLDTSPSPAEPTAPQSQQNPTQQVQTTPSEKTDTTQ